MRTARQETVSALRRAIAKSGMAKSTWARSVGLPPVVASDALRGNGMSVKRENLIRAAVGLPSIVTETITVTIEPGRTYAAVRPIPKGKRPYVSRQIRLTPDEAVEIDEMVRESGCRSFSEWWRTHAAIKSPSAVRRTEP